MNSRPGSKVVDLATAVASVPEGASLSFSGFGHFGHPLAFVHELLRAGTGDFTLHAIAECWPAELLTAAGRVRHINLSNLMFEGLGRVRAICRAVENGEVTTDDHSHLGLALRLLAGGWDVPFLPIRTMAGSDLENIQTGPTPKFARIPSPFSNEQIGVVSALRPDVAVIHVTESDEQGNGILYGQLSVLDAQVRAATHVILTTEKLVTADQIVSNNQLVSVPGILVDQVVHTPFGAYPGGMYGLYDEDLELMGEYYEASRHPETTDRYLDSWIFGIADHDAYLDRIGSQRLSESVVDPVRKLAKGRGEW
ncbi:CoA transferase subunit A [Paramicrobacterium chengjingii]|uniref:CoA transferase subunit A n=1 Tax=Paramicrobacterium chengjingii TaxID=2769067 RepID=UPI00141DDB32|nr:CoA-transferase [Microbacterium chengjingii]